MISFGGLLSLIFLMLVRDVLFPGGVKTVVSYRSSLYVAARRSNSLEST